VSGSVSDYSGTASQKVDYSLDNDPDEIRNDPAEPNTREWIEAQ